VDAGSEVFEEKPKPNDDHAGGFADGQSSAAVILRDAAQARGSSESDSKQVTQIISA